MEKMDDKIVSPKIEIINHFDNLIQRVDIDIEKCLEKYNEEQVIGYLKCYKSYKKKEIKIVRRRENNYYYESFNLFESLVKHLYCVIEQDWLEVERKLEEEMLSRRKTNKDSEDMEFNKIYKTVDLWSEETKVVDYLNQVRMRTIQELRKAQEEALEIYKSQKMDLKSQNKFYFQVLYTQPDPEEWVFKLFTFVTDFYMSPDDISILEKLINANENFMELLLGYSFDEKMFLIGLLQKHFFENLISEKFPSHVISVRKQDLLTIKQIYSTQKMSGINLTNSSSIDLSNLESLYISSKSNRINIDGLLSLESLRLSLDSLELLSLKNLPSLRHLSLNVSNPYRIGSTIQSKVLDYLPSIEYLTLDGDLSDFNLDSLVNLKSLSLSGSLDKDFNFDLFKYICNQLIRLSISYDNIDNKCLYKLFSGLSFPFLTNFSFFHTEISKLEKKLFNGFSQLISLDLSNSYIDSLDNTLFSGLVNLKYLYLFSNKFKSIEANIFSDLPNLRLLDLSDNQLTVLDPKAFSSLKNLRWLDLNNNKLVEFDLSILDYIKEIRVISALGNPIINKQEILDYFKESEIEFVI